MASERDAAKGAISGKEDVDPELAAQLQDAMAFRLDLVKEENRHTENLEKGKLGWFGRLFGGPDMAPTVVACLAMLLFAGIGIGCLLAAYNFAENSIYWGDHARNAFAVSLSALGFVFGRSTKG